MSLDLDDLTYRIRLDDSEVDRAAARTSAQMQRLGGSFSAGGRQAAELARGTKLTRQEMLALNYTVNDVAASLASGASPFTILLQQGGQVTQAFGGIGPTFGKLTSLVTVGRVAVGGLAAALGGLTAAYVQGARESLEFEKNQRLTNNAAGLTLHTFQQLGSEVAQASGATIGSSRAVLQQLVSTGKFGGEALRQVAIAAAATAKATGQTEEAVVKAFSGMSRNVATWAAEHNRATNYITVEQYKYIANLEKQGRLEEAQVYNAKLLQEAAGRVNRSLGSLERAWNAIKGAASGAWDAMLNIGREESTVDQITRLQKELDRKVQQGPTNDLPAVQESHRKGVERLRQEIYLLQEKAKLEGRAADLQAANAARNRKAIDEEEEKARRKDKGPKRDFLNEGLDRLDDQIRERLDRVADSEEETIQKENARRSEDYRRRVAQASDFGRQLFDQAAGINVMLVRDDEARGRAQIELERQQIEARIDEMQIAPLERKVLEDQVASYIAARERQLTEELKPEYQRQLDLYRDMTRYMQQASDDFRAGFISNGREMFKSWVRDGKLSTEQLKNFIIDRFASMVYDQYLAGIFDQLGRSIFGAFTGFGGGGSLAVDTGGFGIGGGLVSLVDLGLGAGRAAGGEVRRGTLYPVNELGTEMLTVRGRDYLMMGAESGTVTPADKWQAGKAISIDASTTIGSIGSGVSRAEMQAVMAQNAARTEARIRRLIDQGKL